MLGPMLILVGGSAAGGVPTDADKASARARRYAERVARDEAIAAAAEEVYGLRPGSLSPLGREPEVLLLHALRTGSADMRLRAARTLGEMKAGNAIPYLIELLHHDDERVRKQAAESLQMITLKNFGADVTKWETWWDRPDGYYGLLKGPYQLPIAVLLWGFVLFPVAMFLRKLREFLASPLIVKTYDCAIVLLFSGFLYYSFFGSKCLILPRSFAFHGHDICYRFSGGGMELLTHGEYVAQLVAVYAILVGLIGFVISRSWLIRKKLIWKDGRPRLESPLKPGSERSNGG